jgi:hypothetical protein
MLIPGEIVANLLPSIKIRKDVLKKCLTGSPIFPSFLEKPVENIEMGEKVCIFCGNQLVGMYNFIGKENLTAKPELVLN